MGENKEFAIRTSAGGNWRLYTIKVPLIAPDFFSKMKPVSMRLCGERDFPAGAIGGFYLNPV